MIREVRKSGAARWRCRDCDNAKRKKLYHEKEKNNPAKVAARKERWHTLYDNDPNFRERQRNYAQERLATPEGQAARQEAQYKYDHSEKGRNRSRKSYEKHGPKYAARQALSNAVADGVVAKPTACQRCHLEVGRPKLEGHHYLGYGPEHFYDVIWLCRPCHIAKEKEDIANAQGMIDKQTTA